MMSKNEISRCVLLATLFAVSTTLTGCASSNRLPVNGEVSFDGEPVEYGYVQFTPMAGTTGPTAGADIKDGVYEVASVRGLMKGSYHVEIQAWQRSGGVSVDPITGERTPGGDLMQILPAKYNKESKLTVEIEPGKRTFDFHLNP